MSVNLRSLKNERAPHGFAARVLRAVGLTDHYARVASPLGDVYVAWNRAGISAVMHAPDDAAFERRFRDRFGRAADRGADLPAGLETALASVAAGRARKLAYDLRSCSPFESAVLRKALEIPRGQVRPYGWIAREIGRPKAVRAVGTALKKNPVPLLIPCHRVVRTDGMIGEYALGGPLQKRRVLAAEAVDLAALARDALAGVRFHGSVTTKIFCFPTCADARRTKAVNTAAFASEEAARRAGYRPCKHCRPARAS